MNQIATQDKGALMESVLIGGDLSKLTPEQRSTYYLKVCDSVGLNHFTKPFEYITLNGKLTLYAKRDATDQLRTVHGVSVEEMTETEREGVFIVTCKVKNSAGRTDVSKGAVNISGLKGDALANAMMKAETKAKRRATLSICGLGFLDETEVETISDAKIGEPAAPVNNKSYFKNASLRNSFISTVIKDFESAADLQELDEWQFTHSTIIEQMKASGNEHDALGVQELRNRYTMIRKGFTAKADVAASFGDGFAGIKDDEQVPSFIGRGAA